MKWYTVILRSAVVLAVGAMLLGCSVVPLTSASSPAPSPSLSLQPTPLPAVTLVPEGAATVAIMPASAPGQIAWLSIPEIDVGISVVEATWHVEEAEGMSVAVWDPDEMMVSHLFGSAGFGQKGNCVLVGHSGGTSEPPFARLGELEIGDRIVLSQSPNDEIVYEVTGSTLLQVAGSSLEGRLADAEVLDPTSDSRLTLVTCWPDWGYTHRLVVTAHETSSIGA